MLKDRYFFENVKNCDNILLTVGEGDLSEDIVVNQKMNKRWIHLNRQVQTGLDCIYKIRNVKKINIGGKT